MSKLSILLLVALFGLAAAQSDPDSPAGGNGPGVECPEPQCRGKKCGQVSRDDCLYIDWARKECKNECDGATNAPPTEATEAPQQQQQQQQKAPKKKKKGCFHGSDMVQTKEHGVMSMSELSQHRHAHVLTRNDQGVLEYSPVRYWLHAQPSVSMKFYTLRTESGHRLAITGDHLIYETDCRGNGGHAIYAKKVRLGRCLYVKNEQGRMIESPVVEKETEKMTGIYSPITTTGSIVVNDVLASCYNYYENEALQKFVYQLMIGAQETLADWLPSSLYEAAFNSQEGASVAVPRLILNFLQLSDYFVH